MFSVGVLLAISRESGKSVSDDGDPREESETHSDGGPCLASGEH